MVNQQGRVTLEADWNEAACDRRGGERAELIEVIGVSGTPTTGTGVTVTGLERRRDRDRRPGRNRSTSAGERMVLDIDLDYVEQPDWIDTTGDPLGSPRGCRTEPPTRLCTSCSASRRSEPSRIPRCSTSRSAVQISQRLRIVQRVVRHATDQATCSGALGDLEQAWAAEEESSFDGPTMRLDSASSLQVSFRQPPGAPTPCEPAAQGGYLGAENQLIRVQVASVDANGVPTLAWGLRQRVLPLPDRAAHGRRGRRHDHGHARQRTGRLVPPAAGRPGRRGAGAAAELTTTDYIAATTGIVTTAASAYQPDSQQLVISTALAATTTASPQLFLRVWQETIVYTVPGPVALANTGIQVTLASSTGVYHPGDYYFAVRPGTPAMVSPVYPQRIPHAPQTPDGPRLWACPLAVVAWADGLALTVTDCRQHFGGLTSVTVEQEGCCCTIEVTPDDVGGGAKLQELINRYASRGSATICLQPGYTLPRPLVIKGSANLTIRGC